MNRFKTCMIILTLCVASNLTAAKDKTKEEPISEFKQLPNLSKAEYAKETILNPLTATFTRVYLKALLKAVMYIDRRVRILESKSDISAPLLKEVTSVRNAIKKITGTDKAVVEAQAETVPETIASSTISETSTPE